MPDITSENPFQYEVLDAMVAQGWQRGDSAHYNREYGLYTPDLLSYIQTTQPEAWQKYEKAYPENPEQNLLKLLEKQLNKKGTLSVLRAKEIKDRGVKLKFCQFMPEHNKNPVTLDRYQKNILRVVPELVYSPWGEAGRIDLVCFVNGVPVVTMELKSEFKQTVTKAIWQYRKDRLPQHPKTKKKEPLLTFKRGALVHFAVSQYGVYMSTHLQGNETTFLPFNKGKQDGSAGNDIPKDISTHATAYLWQEVLQPDALLNILSNFIHVEQKEKEDPQGRKYIKESLIFPRYHQWDVVRKLLGNVKTEGSGQKYLIQHSAGSGKSNSIAWTAHQLASLYRAGEKCFASVIVVTDRTVLDRQLQDTISQFEQTAGVVGRINHDEGSGSKSEKLAEALSSNQPIIIVTLQTFPFVVDAIANDVTLKDQRYAIIADEAHTSQTGSTARKLREVLRLDSSAGDDLSSEEILQATLAARRSSPNLSYFAFTATPKPKTLELFGRRPDSNLPASASNKPEAFHVYTMRQAIEEGFILDVLKNYTTYKVLYNLGLKAEEADKEVDGKRAKIKLTQWARLHEYNIAQKVALIVEHFKENVRHLLKGQAKAMLITSSRKEAVRYKMAFDAYIKDKQYTKIHAMVAFSGEVQFNASDPQSAALMGEKFTEQNMNTGLKGRTLRHAFDTSDYQVMIVANKFQTGFDQPKLCAMYVDKKLGGVDCVQTLSRLNRTYPNKADSGTFILDFVNESADILEAFQPYYKTAELTDVSEPNQIYDLEEKLKESPLIYWPEVEQFCELYFDKNKKTAAVGNVCRRAVERWESAYRIALDNHQRAKKLCALAKLEGTNIDLGNAELTLKTCRAEKDALDIFKKDLGSFVRLYEFMSQIVDYDDLDIEKFALYARHLRPLLREVILEEEAIDLNELELTGYTILESQREQHLVLKQSADAFLTPGSGMGSAKPRDREAVFISEIIQRLNDLFAGEDVGKDFLLNYTQTVKDEIARDDAVVSQIKNNSFEQAIHGDLLTAAEDAVIGSDMLGSRLKNIVLGDAQKTKMFAHIIFDMFKQDELR